MSLIKRLFVFSLVLTTVLWSMGPVNFVNAAGNYGAGSLLALEGVSGSAVYYIGSDGMKYVFPDGKTYATWYDNFNDVVKVDVAELDLYADGGAMTYRAGTKLVTHANTAKIYAVGPGGLLHWIPTAEVAEALYGANWGSMVMDTIPGFFSSSYVSGSDLSDTYPDGTLLQMGEDLYYVMGGDVRPFADADAFEANNFSYDNLVDVTDVSDYGTGESITGEETVLSGFMPAEASNDNNDTPVVVDGDLTVMLYNSPAALNIPTGSPNDFLGLKLTAGSSAASVESIKLTSYGLGGSTEIDSVTVYQDGIKIGTSKNINSDREATFNFSTPIVVAANSSVVLMVRATLTGSSAGETYALGIASASDVTTGGTVGGSFPMQGNLMSAVSATIGGVSINTIDTTASAPNFGEDNVLLASFNVAATSVEPLLWENARFRNGGTNNSDVVSNLRAEVDGTVVDDGVSLVGKYVNFDMGNLLIAKGESVTLDIYGDIGVANINNTVDLYIDDVADFGFLGQTYGFGIQIADITSLDAAGDGIVATLAASDFTIDIDKAVSPAKDVKAGDDNVVLAVVSFTSNGENATINDITNTSSSDGDFYISGTGLQSDDDSDTSTQEATNFEMRDIDSGIIYDVTATASSTLGSSYNEQGWTLAMTDEINLVSGVTRTFEFRVDLSGSNDNDPVDDADTLKLWLEDGAFSITGDASDAAITDITPSSVAGSVNTVRDGAVNVTTVVLTDKSVVGGAGTADPIIVFKTGLEVGDSSDLTLTSFRVDVASTTAYTAFKDDNIAQLDLYIVEDGVERLLKSTSNDIVNDGATNAYITFSSLNSTNRVLTAGKDVELIIKAVFASTLPTTGTFGLVQANQASYMVFKDDQNTNVAETLALTFTRSRLMTLASTGTLKAALLTTDTKANNDSYILAGSETSNGSYFGELEFTTANESIKLTDIALEEYGSSTGSDVKVVKLYDSAGTMVAYKSPSAAGHVHFEEADFIGDANILPADESTSFFIGVLTKSINADGDAEGTATFDRGIQFSFATSSAIAAFSDLSAGEAVKATGVDSGDAITIIEDTDGTLSAGEYDLASVKTKTASTTGSILNVVTSSLSNGTLAGGNNKIIGEYTFVFDNGSNRTATNTDMLAMMRELILTIATSTNVGVTNVQAYIEGDAGNKTTAVTGVTGTATIDLTTLTSDTESVDGTVVLVIEADLSVSGANEYVQTNIADLTTDFTYNGNNRTGTTYWSNARIEGLSQVTGATLSN